MRDFFKLKTWLITVIIVILALGISIVLVHYEFKKETREARAGSIDNVSGFAWSENIGWISFNSTDCDTDENGFIDTDVMVLGCGGDNSTDIAFDYGVNINRVDGWFLGYAWSPHVGWIDFAPTGYPSDPQYNHAVRLLITDDEDLNKKVAGWAKILSMNDDGWIKMTGTSTAGDPYGVKLNVFNSLFSGYAWNANSDGSGIGWISFNNTDYQVYGFFNAPPTVSFPPMSFPGYCDYDCACGFQGVLKPQLRWIFEDDPGSAQTFYEVVFHTVGDDPETISDAGLVGPGTLLPLKTDKREGEANSFYPHDNFFRPVTIDYDQSYYWWVRAWDNYGASSTWTQFYDPDNPDGDSSDYTFTTYKHEFPMVDFTWFPQNPSKGEEVEFTDASKVYETGPGSPKDCDEDKCDWEWTFPVSTTTFIEGTTASSTLVVTFNTSEPVIVSLKVTDGTGYNCSKSQVISTKLELPIWKEIKTE